MYHREIVSVILLILVASCIIPVFKAKMDSLESAVEGVEVSESTVVQDSYFVVVDEWCEDGEHYSIVYASDTKVMYLMCNSPYRFGITELYNRDGSIRLYE